MRSCWTVRLGSVWLLGALAPLPAALGCSDDSSRRDTDEGDGCDEEACRALDQYNDPIHHRCCGDECVAESICVSFDAACSPQYPADEVPCQTQWIDFPPDGVCCAGMCVAGLTCAGTSCVPTGRYVLLDPGTGSLNGPCPGVGCDGSGRVQDTTSGLVWARYRYLPESPSGQTQAEAAAHCAGAGMRLPTADEALSIAGLGFDPCAWPMEWATWTSSPGPTGTVAVVYSAGHTYNQGPNDSAAVLCLQ
jgi:hypothetical protein